MPPTPSDNRRFAFWRRSVQARVVLSVIVLSAVVVGVIGWVLIRQISDGLVDNRVDISVAEAGNETKVAQERLDSAGTTDADPTTQLRQLVDSLVERGRARGFEVVVQGPVDASRGQGTRTSPGVRPVSVPADLRAEVERSSGVSWTYTRIRYDSDQRRGAVPGVAVGDQVRLPSDGGTYDLFLLFDFGEEEDTVALLRRSLITAGVLLLALLAGMTYLVTRQVVTPIQLTRRVAERIASGRLTERVHVSGEDDIARLGRSFNSMADSLQTQIRRLEQLSLAQRQFVSDVSHELRTPLTTVRMAGEVLHGERNSFDPTTRRAAELLQTELERFETLLTDLLEISRFDAGAAALEVEEVDLLSVVRRTVEATSPLAERRGVRVEVSVDDRSEDPVTAEVDVRRVERVLRNLLSNAIDHADVSGETAAGLDGDLVEVCLMADRRAVAVTVRDHGVGLQPGQSAQVFNRFWRADPARARTTGGTGLGLSIALEDARLHGGWLQAWGLPGRGAQFRLTLPRVAGEDVEHSPLPLSPAGLRDLGRRRRTGAR
ncbi:hypothetical protein GCM10011519_33050 [Marmoricola endophyticus]|uniref:Sensor histidine kinase MtrB n=1 Tax=Marmoricola endophyticus TaxID=2040280 RepID=A0A917F7V2_9ACTN|nr:MtrAB system histidine kinase MtrB [Marmoricola endophyticus]GGF56494.1 hypothetical protein GCM10011519_33050 [Marmoricola endophyticus]